MIATLLALLAVVNSPYNPPSYSCDGVTAVYPVPFPYPSYTDLVVTSTTIAGIPTTLVYTTDYTVNLTSTSSTATLTLNSPATKCPTGNTLKITRNTALTQPNSFKAQTTYNQTLHEQTYDRIEMQVQQTDAKVLALDIKAYVDQVVNATLTGGTTVQPLTWAATGDGSTVTFSISNAVVSSAELYNVTIDGLLQKPTTDYSVSSAGAIITFVAAPALNAAIVVRSFGYARALNVSDSSQVLATGSSTSRDLAHRFADVISLADNGALCDGVSNDGPALSASIAKIPSTGGLVVSSCDLTIAAPLSITIPSGKPVFIDLRGHKLILKHTSGVGLEFTRTAGVRQPFVLANGTIAYGGSSAGVTGMKLTNLIQARLQDLKFAGFTANTQIALQLDFVEDSIFDNLNFEGNNGTGTIALDLTNFANANAYRGLQFQQNWQAVRIRGGTSGSWFSDCLVQSQTGTHAVTVEVTGADANITGTHFRTCWFENNGDTTANADAIFFNTDVGKVITNTTLIGNTMFGTGGGGAGVAMRFSATGTPLGSITSIGNYYNTFASVFGGTVGNGAKVISINDKDDTHTITAAVQLATDGTDGITFKPQGGTKIWRLFGGYSGAQDSTLVFRDVSASTDILTYSSSTWSFLKSIAVTAGNQLSLGRAALTYSASITPNLQTCQICTITVTNGTAFTVNAPLNGITGTRLTIWNINTSGGVEGAITWNAAFHFANATAPAAPANGKRFAVEFEFDGSLYYETWRSANDLTN